jgi:2'-hydroxyisoflavone reductase
MRILLIGGTKFLGRQTVSAALARGHEVTAFNRGNNKGNLPPGVRHVQGDRTADLSGLAEGEWDAVIDTCGYFPREVKATAELLAPRVGHYIFVSSISVYSDLSVPGINESSPVGELAADAPDEVNGETYGPLKVLCELEAERAFPGRSTAVRAGLIVGEHDPTDRFTYWVRRCASGGRILAPGDPEAATQFIDVRDLAEWMVRVAENRTMGVFNATGPIGTTITMRQVLEGALAAAPDGGELDWRDEAFLLNHGVVPWSELPLWLPTEGHAGFGKVDCSRAAAAGLTTRTLQDTLASTLAWDRTRTIAADDMRAGMKSAREAELLALS